MTNIVGFAWESALFALRNYTMQPRKEMTLMQPKLPQDERHEQRLGYNLHEQKNLPYEYGCMLR